MQKRTRIISSHHDRTSLVSERFVIWTFGFEEKFSCGTQHVIPSGQDSAVLPARVASHNEVFVSPCLLMELAIITLKVISNQRN